MINNSKSNNDKLALLLLIMSIFITACSTGPAKTTETYRSLNVETSKKDRQQYFLLDQKGRVVSRGYGNNGKLSFSLDRLYNPGNQCFKVVDRQRKVFGKLEAINLSVLPEFRKTESELKQINASLRSLQSQSTRNKRALNNSKQQLASNRAYKNGSCILPKQRYLAPKPATKCSSEYQCKQEGGAICYSMTFGSTGCSIAASELNISGMLTSPFCGATAAKLAKQKYGLGDAVADAIIGGIEDEAKSTWDQGNWFGALFLGAIAVGGKYLQAESCTDNFIKKHYLPLANWKQRKAYIEREPHTAIRQCKTSLASIEQYPSKQKNINRKLTSLHEKKKLLETRYNQLKLSASPVQHCKR